jgi:putative FmdB family regulatory protein
LQERAKDEVKEMPLYEYECASCGHRFELIQRFSDPPAERCKACGGGPIHKLLSAPAIQFKGTGWYVTDYGRGNGNGRGNGKVKDSSGGSDTGSAAAADSGSASASASGSGSGSSKDGGE